MQNIKQTDPLASSRATSCMTCCFALVGVQTTSQKCLHFDNKHYLITSSQGAARTKGKPSWQQISPWTTWRHQTGPPSSVHSQTPSDSFASLGPWPDSFSNYQQRFWWSLRHQREAGLSTILPLNKKQTWPTKYKGTSNVTPFCHMHTQSWKVLQGSKTDQLNWNINSIKHVNNNYAGLQTWNARKSGLAYWST